MPFKESETFLKHKAYKLECYQQGFTLFIQPMFSFYLKQKPEMISQIDELSDI